MSRDLPINVTGDRCYVNLHLHPPNFITIHELGIFDTGSFFDYSLPSFLLQLGLIFIFTQCLHLILRRLLFPRLASEILAGIILGPTGFGRIPFVANHLFQKRGRSLILLVSKFGYIFFIFISGVKMEPKMILRKDTKPWFIGLLSVILPSGGALLYTNVFAKGIAYTYQLPSLRSVVLTQNMYSFPVTASMLLELKITNSELGRLALSSALISDFVSNIVVMGTSHGKLWKKNVMISMLVQSTLSIVLLISIIVFVGSPICEWIIKHTPKGKPVRRGHITLITVSMLVIFMASDFVGLQYMYGPFILGLVIPKGPPLGATLVEKFEAVISGLFAPLMVTYCGMVVQMNMLFEMDFIRFLLLGLGICLMMKVISILFVSLCCGESPTTAVALALIMSAQGIVQLAYYYQDALNQEFDWGTFSILVTAVLFQAAIFHPMLRILCGSKVSSENHIRDIGHVPLLNSGIRILTCAHQLEEVLGFRKVLEACFSTIESPLTVYAVHILQLVSRAQPELIDHQLGPISENDGKSQEMIDAISLFEQEYEGYVSVEQYTAVSQLKFAHHDICQVAFSKAVSLIILPFHRKWNHLGQLVEDSNNLRVMYNEVLEQATCSVAIFIDRTKMMEDDPLAMYNVGMPFFGGEDDREALAFAIRMVGSQNVRLIIIRFVPWHVDWGESQENLMLDSDVLKHARLAGQEKDNVAYREERVKDGAESALIIHEMEGICDLMIVGRRHKDEMPQLSGLSEWNDLPELGPVGDMLASSDLTNPLSVLVVQHQNPVKRR